MSGLATAVTHLRVLALCEACFACLCGLVPVSSCLMAIVLVVTQYVCCLSDVDWILVVVHRELGYHPVQQAAIFGLIAVPDNHVCHPSPECFGFYLLLSTHCAMPVLR